MQTRFLITTLLITLLVSACSSAPIPSTDQSVPTAPASLLEPGQPAPEMAPEPARDATPEVETALPNCLGGAVSPIGQSIAEEYESVSYDQVLTWFCNGAEFEDILVALETEAQTGTPAEEMLQMLVDGFSWDDIWQIIELTD